MTDQSLLEEFVRDGSAQAFRAIVARYAGLVRASALRQVRDSHVADDVTQAVFIVLARRAATIRDAAVLPAWLIKTTCFASRDALKLEARRRKHEQKAAEMAPTQTQIPERSDFAEIAPLLDAALAKLKTADRNIVARRYLQQQSVETIATELKLSEAAVRKRLSRAMPKLRAYLSRHGVTMSVAALSAAMLSAPPAAADAALIRSTANAALAAVEGATISASAASIASAVFVRVRLMRLTAAIAMFLVLALIGGAGFALQRAGATAARLAAPPAGPKIKLGIMLSDYTITGPAGGHMGQGFGGLNIGLQRTDDPRIERFAIIEPGTANKGNIPTLLKRFFPPGNVIDGTSPQQLRKLDVIACFSATNMRDEVLDAMIEVVRDEGVGMLNQVSTGCNRPGLTERVDLVNGMKRHGCLVYETPWPCDVLADHPIIAELKPMIGSGKKIRLEANFVGSIGVLPEGAVPLIAAPGIPNLHHIAQPVPPETVFYPLYTSHLGKGRILGLQWNGAQQDLEAMTSGKFYVRCIQWLANEPLDP